MSSLFTDAFGGGWALGNKINDTRMQGKQRRASGVLSQMLRGGDFSGAAGLMAQNGQTNEALRAAQIPLQQQRLDQQQEFAQNQFMDNSAFRNQQADFQRQNTMRDDEFRRMAYEQEQANRNQPNLPNGYMFEDPANPSAGVKQLPGLPTHKPSPSSPLGKIQADFEAGLIDQQTRDAALAKATAGSNGITVNPDGTVQIGGSGKAATEGQAKANIYATRGVRANAILDRLENQGTELSQALISGVPIAGNYMTTPAYKQYEQAQRDFINATLRQESGAVIADTEFDNARKQYFPQPGDDPQTIAQKRQNRSTAMQSIREASGPFAIKGQMKQQEPINVPSPQSAGKTRESAIPVTSEQEAENLPSGSFFVMNGRVGRIK